MRCVYPKNLCTDFSVLHRAVLHSFKFVLFRFGIFHFFCTSFEQAQTVKSPRGVWLLGLLNSFNSPYYYYYHFILSFFGFAAQKGGFENKVKLKTLRRYAYEIHS